MSELSKNKESAMERLLKELEDCLSILEANCLEPKHQESIRSIIRESEEERQAKELKAEMDNVANYEHDITTTGEGW